MLQVQPHGYKGPVLSIKNLSLKLGDNLILRDINQEILNVTRPGLTQGQVITILGRSGIGKTQLFKTIAGLQSPTTGEVLLGEKLTPVKAGTVGVVFQNYPITERLTVLGTLLRAGRQGGLSTKQAKEKALDLLAKFGIAERKNFFPAQLSGGQRQRVAIIEQIMCSEKFILMDEPFSGLDYGAKQKACEMITMMAASNENNTVIIITHDIDTGLEVAHEVWLMGRDKDGQGNFVPGARIIEKLDLAEMGLAWQPGIQFTSEFSQLVQQLKARFIDPNGPYV